MFDHFLFCLKLFVFKIKTRCGLNELEEWKHVYVLRTSSSNMLDRWQQKTFKDPDFISLVYLQEKKVYSIYIYVHLFHLLAFNVCKWKQKIDPWFE